MDQHKYERAQAKRFSGENKAARNRLKQAYRFIKPIVKSDRPLLDVGCRDGWFIEYLGKKHFTDCVGMELTEKAVQHAQQRGRNVIQGDAHTDLNQFEDQQFNTILMIHSLEHCHSPKTVVEEVYRILQQGGVLYIEVPLEDSPTLEVAHYCSFQSIHDVIDLVGDNFELLKQKSIKMAPDIVHLMCAFRKKQ